MVPPEKMKFVEKIFKPKKKKKIKNQSFCPNLIIYLFLLHDFCFTVNMDIPATKSYNGSYTYAKKTIFPGVTSTSANVK